MKRVVVIGGGFAGSFVAKKLQNKFKVTLIDSKDYFEFTPGILRAIVHPEHLTKIQILHKDYLGKVKLVKGNVSEIDRNHLFVKGEKVIFDYLIICSGSKYANPIKASNLILASRSDMLIKSAERVRRAKNILIIGGGLVGVELAGELCTFYPDKKITLIHSGDKLIERNHGRAINYADNFLRKRDVEIIFNDRIVEFGKKFKSLSGRVFSSDFTFLCTGISPNFEFMRKNFSHLINKNNFIKVNEFLQLEGFENIFVAGDITDRVEEKTAQNAVRQGKIVVRNILRYDSDKNLLRYKFKKTPLVISLGKYNGIFSLGSFVLTGIIPAFMKWGIEKFEMLQRR